MDQTININNFGEEEKKDENTYSTRDLAEEIFIRLVTKQGAVSHGAMINPTSLDWKGHATLSFAMAEAFIETAKQKEE